MPRRLFHQDPAITQATGAEHTSHPSLDIPPDQHQIEFTAELTAANIFRILFIGASRPVDEETRTALATHLNNITSLNDIFKNSPRLINTVNESLAEGEIDWIDFEKQLRKYLDSLPNEESRDIVVVGKDAPDKALHPPLAGTTAPRMKAMPKRNRPKTSLRAAARATMFREKSKTGSTKNRNYPGYVQPNRINTKPVSARVSTDKVDTFNSKLKSENVTMQELFSVLVDEVIEKGIPPELKQALLKQDMVRMRKKYGQFPPSLGNS